MMRSPTYLRVIATTKCPLSCSYCHMEGDRHQGGTAWELDADTLDRCLAVAVAAGIRKFKFLGGEPLVRRDLPKRIAALRALALQADLSIVTSGVGAVEQVDALFAAGLNRMNLSIHGFTVEAFAERSRLPGRHHGQRAAVLLHLLKRGRPLKLNYVYTGPSVEADLGALLDFAAGKPLVVNVLDELGNAAMSAQTLLSLVRRLRGPWLEQYEEPDADSLPATRLRWADGLVVEVKTSQLGLVAPWQDCAQCPARPRCREGIFAVRLTHRGHLQPCMDRPDVSLPLTEVLTQGHELAVAAWKDFVGQRLRRGEVPTPLSAQPRRLPVLQMEGLR